MPIGGSNRLGRGKFVDNSLMSSLLDDGIFPQHCTLEVSRITKTIYGDVSYDWDSAGSYVNIPCRKYDRLPHDNRTLEIIEELKYWTIALAGYFPNIDPSWRVRIVETGEIYAIDGVDTDSLHIMTIITAHVFVPSAEVKTG